ncbi:uncharacterized protein LOC113654230 [Tachysurus fulvidraco]|uniref:uncharacterized protein LOC113654230 n=1 Tax=Tachysurus fulvidraco TaxID=1234273 RepID=UPI000F4DACB8|nr:uncharacterized protein LOC113654230 [Tachysurus fulvidraco]
MGCVRLTGMRSESKELLSDETARDTFGPAASPEHRVGCMSVMGVLLLGVGGLLSVLAAGPLHAHCSVTWTVDIPCFDASSLLVNQIKEWTTDHCPLKSQKCLFSLTSVIGDDIIATHTTPVMRFIDDITFNFSSTSSDSCEIKGHSTSRSWYTILDSGSNYLNMYSLMRASGLSSAPSFTESTSDRTCTQYSSIRLKLNS